VSDLLGLSAMQFMMILKAAIRRDLLTEIEREIRDIGNRQYWEKKAEEDANRRMKQLQREREKCLKSK